MHGKLRFNEIINIQWLIWTHPTVPLYYKIVICQYSHCAHSIELIFAVTILGCARSRCTANMRGNVLNTLTFDLVQASLPTIQPSAIAPDALSLKTIVRTWTNHVSRQLRGPLKSGRAAWYLLDAFKLYYTYKSCIASSHVALSLLFAFANLKNWFFF